jgi:hypothetical protein
MRLVERLLDREEQGRHYVREVQQAPVALERQALMVDKGSEWDLLVVGYQVRQVRLLAHLRVQRQKEEEAA